MHLGLVGHQFREYAAEPERLGGEVAAAAVALVEDQVDDCQNGVEAVRKQVGRRHAKRDPGGLDLALGPHEPLGHGLLGNEEGAGDLLGPQPAQRPQRECDLRLERQRRVAAGEQQLEPLIGDRHFVHVVLTRPPAHPAGGSWRRACGPGGCGRSPGSVRWSPARRGGWRASPRGASEPQRPRTPPGRLPRRGRSRRGSRSGRRGHVPTRRGRPARESVPLLVMLPRFWVVSTKPGAALARVKGSLRPLQGRGWFLAPRDRGPEAGVYCLKGHP